MSDRHITARSLHFSVLQNLLAAQMLLLKGPEFVFFSLGFPQKFLLFDLLGTFVHNGTSLLRVHSLEVVGLDSVISEHRLLGQRVFGHKIMGLSEVHLVSLLVNVVGSLGIISISLRLSHLCVRVLHGFEHGSPLSSVLVLLLSQQFVQVQILRIVSVLVSLSLFSVKFFLSLLLSDPVSLL